MKIDLGDLPTEVEMPVSVLIFPLKCKITTLYLWYRKTGVCRRTEVPAVLPQHFSLEKKIFSYISSHSALGSGWVARTSPQCRDVIFFCVGVHQKFKSFKSDSYEHGGEAFSLQYGSGQLLGIAGKDTLQVSVHLKWLSASTSAVCRAAQILALPWKTLPGLGKGRVRSQQAEC